MRSIGEIVKRLYDASSKRLLRRKGKADTDEAIRTLAWADMVPPTLSGPCEIVRDY